MSILQVQDSTFVSIKIGGQDVPGQPNFFDELCIIENVNQVVPTFTFTFNDSQNDLVKSLHLSDGMLIEVKISNTQDFDKLSRFRIFNGDAARSASSGHVNTFNCVLDAPKYLGGSARIGIKGSTSDVIKRIASECNLKFKGDFTNDAQVWISAGMTFNQWARHAANHAYVSDSSCMMVAVTEDSELLYRDIIKLIVSTSPVKEFASSISIPNAISIYGNKSHTASGLLNNWVNYGYIARKDGVSGKYEIYEKVTVQKQRLTSIANNTEVSDLVDVARIDLFPFNCGNTYDKYEQAYYQNFRLRSTFSETMSLIVYDFTGLNLFDVVKVTIAHDVGDLTPTVKSGIYILIGKTKIIKSGVSYGERLELIRNSTQNNGVNPLAT